VALNTWFDRLKPPLQCARSPNLYLTSYTVFNADGALDGKVDCNAFSGTYSQTNGFTIKLGPSTTAFCGEVSLDTQYLQLLSQVAAGGPDGAGGLALKTAGGEQRMLFKNGSPAPKP
jgi:heat shock protein HslJ